MSKKLNDIEMNYDKMAIFYFNKLANECPNLTFGELLYTITRGISGKSLSFLLKKSGRDYCTLIEKSIKEEKDEF